MARPIKPEEVKEPQPILYDPLNQYKHIKPFRRT
jgi:hypothetical protein